ncbi:MAG: amidophosphoribosyltransferase [Oscillospiraceae bacterium]|jgi:amidophosphoribosyltransferase|nr:amidophosphoribosyltransferase [Oscillospiraceae bacterium]
MVDFYDDKPHDECGVFGYFCKDTNEHLAAYAYSALFALQHRGQESCGICVSNDGVMTVRKELGLVSEVFSQRDIEELGAGNMAVGHVRYSTTGASKAMNAQPIIVHHKKGSMAIAHNGNLTNANELRDEFESDGGIFHTTSDTEVIAYAITRARLTVGAIEDAVEAAMKKIKGAYSIVVMSPRKMIAARDPYGLRPLCMGRHGDDIVFASESCALGAVGASFVRDIEPGEIIVVTPKGVSSINTFTGGKKRMCVFEYVYIARPDSVIDGESVHIARKRAGVYLARAHPVAADVVIGSPDSGLDAALGYSEESGIPYGVGITKNRYVARTFIQPTQEMRRRSITLKLSALKATIDGKRVVLVDDSIVRGNTMRQVVSMLRLAGAAEIHLRISSPPFRYPCYFGIDVDTCDNLIANQMTTAEIAEYLGADSIGYLGIEDVRRIARVENSDFCVGCFSGEYPCEPPIDSGKRKFERKLSERGTERER